LQVAQRIDNKFRESQKSATKEQNEKKENAVQFALQQVHNKAK